MLRWGWDGDTGRCVRLSTENNVYRFSVPCILKHDWGPSISLEMSSWAQPEVGLMMSLALLSLVQFSIKINHQGPKKRYLLHKWFWHRPPPIPLFIAGWKLSCFTPSSFTALFALIALLSSLCVLFQLHKIVWLSRGQITFLFTHSFILCMTGCLTDFQYTFWING